MEENENVVEESTNEEQDSNYSSEVKNKNKKGIILIVFVVVVLLSVLGFCIYTLMNNGKDKNTDEKSIETKDSEKSAYYMEGNEISEFDLAFLKLENEQKNKIYSPLSIKYALNMLSEGANGETKKQIDSVVGKYQGKKYTNSNNLSLANALFVRDTYKDKVKSTYTSALTNKYNAEVIYDSFQSANTINDWISNKTFKLINNMVNDSAISQSNFVLTNALAIDMEWNNTIKPTKKEYWVDFKHEKFSTWVSQLNIDGYKSLDFNNASMKAKAADIAAVANRYDIVATLGKEKIAQTLKDEYQKWLDGGTQGGACPGEVIEESGQAYVDKNLDKYLDEFEKNKNHISSSTDFYFYNDNNVKVFAKDLKTYDGTTLEYVGIMPTNVSLDNYVSSVKAADISKIVSSLKPIELNSFKDGVITSIKGNIPMFKYDDELKLVNDLKKIGITDVFNETKSDLSNLSTEKAAIGDASHKANIEFSNEGIKASAATTMSGIGGGACGFLYEFEVPVEEIDLTFDKPYMYIIRDKDTNEVWFTGTVYEPTTYENPVNGNVY